MSWISKVRSVLCSPAQLCVLCLLATATWQSTLAVAAPGLGPSEQENGSAQLNVLRRAGSQALAKGDRQAAVKHWLQALSLLGPSGDGLNRSQLHYQLGVVYWQLAKQAEAIRHLQTSLSLAQEAKNQQLEAQALNLLGVLKFLGKDYSTTIRHQTAYLHLPPTASDSKGRAVALATLGMAYNFMQNQVAALHYLPLAREALLHLPKDNDVVFSLGEVESQLSNLYFKLGDFEQSLYWRQQSLIHAKESGSSRLIADAYKGLAALQYESRNYSESARLLLLSLAIAERLHDPFLQATVLLSLGKVSHMLGNHQDAKNRYQQSLVLSKKLNNSVLLGELYSARGFLVEQEGFYTKSLEDYDKALEHFALAKTPTQRAITLNNRAHAHLQWRQFKAAETDLNESLSILDQVRIPLADGQRISLFNTQASSYNLLQQVLIADQRYGDALLASERGRAQAFVARLADQRRIQEPLPTLQRFHSIARAHHATFVEYSLIPEDSFIHQGRSQGEAAQIYIWVFQPSGAIHFQTVDLHGKGLKLQDLIQRTRDLLTKKTGPHKQQLQQHLQLLHTLLIEPIAPWLPDDPQQTVVLIPHQGLFLLPFAALQDRNGNSLIDQHTVVTAPSLQALDPELWQRRRPSTSARDALQPQALIVGNPRIPSHLEDLDLLPLPGSQKEAETLHAEFFPRNSSILVDKQATETAIKQQMPSARIIHLAAHGLLELEPGASTSERRKLLNNGAIVLSATPQDDGLLTYDEVIQLNLRADLVVLSACDTGRGVITGDGVVGLSRAFMGAGVPSVVVSLWRIPDLETSQLMNSFYQHLRRQKTNKAQALRNAMLTLKATHPDPLYWAGFTLIGAADQAHRAALAQDR